MVLVIVARHIDLSVGSVLGFVGVPDRLSAIHAGLVLACGHPGRLGGGLAGGALPGRTDGLAGRGPPCRDAGGLMSFRGAAFLVADGKTQPVTDAFFLNLGGGYDGAIGVQASWDPGPVVRPGVCCCAWVSSGVPDGATAWRPDPCRWTCWLVAAPAVLLFGFAATMNHYQISSKDAPQGIAGAGADLGRGGRGPVLHRAPHPLWPLHLRHGRQPDAAALVGIPVKRVTLMLFALLGLLITVAAVVFGGAPERRNQLAWQQHGAVCDRRCGDRRHGPVGRHRLHHWARCWAR